MKIVPNPIFIRLSKRSLLATQILASMLEVWLQEYISSLLQANLFFLQKTVWSTSFKKYLISLSEKPFKISPGESTPCDRPYKDLLGEWTQQNILSQWEKIVKMNNQIINADYLEPDSVEVVQSLTIVL